VACCIPDRYAWQSAAGFLLAAIALTWMVSAPAASAEDDARPIVLTNEDIDRIRAQPATDEPRGPGLILTGVTSEAPAPEATGGDTHPAAPAPGAGPQAGSWQEEYYRLKAMALRQAIGRGESIDFMDAIGPAQAESASRDEHRAVEISVPAAGPACMYGKGGILFHQPAGVQCGATRGEAVRRRSSSKYDSCVYDADGGVIYTPTGRRCNRHGG